MRTLSILIMNYPGLPSRMIQLIKRCHFSHSSLGFEEDRATWYSFVKKGFFVENLPRYLKPERAPFDCELFEFQVTDDIYLRVQKELEKFRSQASRCSYAKVGIVLNMLGLPIRFPNQYFCSQFIVEILSRAGAMTPAKPAVLYFPEDFRGLPGATMVFKGKLDALCRYLKLL